MKLPDLIPDADSVLALEPDEIGGALLEHLHSRGVGNTVSSIRLESHETDAKPTVPCIPGG